MKKKYFISVEFWTKYSSVSRHIARFIELDIDVDSVDDAVNKLIAKEFPGVIEDSFYSKIIAFNNIN